MAGNYLGLIENQKWNGETPGNKRLMFEWFQIWDCEYSQQTIPTIQPS